MGILYERWGGGAATLGFAALFAVLWWVYPKMYVFSDPTAYLEIAWELESLRERAGGHLFKHRLGLLLPHWLSYEIFGLRFRASFLPQLGFLLIAVFATLHCCRGLLQKAVASVVLLLLVPFSATVLPDLGVAAFMFLAMLMLMRRGDGVLVGCAFSIFAFYAFLVKTTAYILALPYAAALFVFLWRCSRHSRESGNPVQTASGSAAAPHARQWTLFLDSRFRGNDEKRFYIASIITGIALLAGYGVLCWYLFGHPLARLHELNQANHTFFPAPDTLGAFMQRLVVEAPVAFYGFFGISIVLAGLAALAALSGRFPAHRRLRLIGFYLLAGIAVITVTPVSLSDYRLLPLTQVRQFLFLVPPAALLCAQLISGMFHYGRPGAIGHRGPRERNGALKPKAARPLSRFVPAAAALGLLAALSHQGAMHLLGGYSKEDYATHKARLFAAHHLMESGALVLVSESRTRLGMRMYLRKDPQYFDRMRACGRMDWARQGQDAIILIDRALSGWLSRAYGSPNCDAELAALAAEMNYQVLIDQPARYLAVSPNLWRKIQ